MRRSSLVFALCLSTLAAWGAQAQLSLSMKADKSTLTAGDFVTYTVTLTNTGGGSVGNPTVTVILPLFSVVNFLGPNCSGDGPVVCTTPSIGAGESEDFVVSVRHPVAGPTTVTAKAAPNTLPPNPLSVEVTVTPRKGDLTLTASALTSSVSAGGTLTYRATVANRGPNVLENVLLQLYLPAGVFAKSIPLGCADSHSAIQCYFGAMSPNAPIPLVFQVKAGPDAGTLTTDFGIMTTDVDTDLSNNGTSISTSVFKTVVGPNDADMAVTLSAPTVATNGDTSFTVSFTDLGPAKATSVQLDFVAEADIVVRNISTPYTLNCSSGFNGVTCTMPTIGVGAVIPVTFTVRGIDGSAPKGEFRARISAAQHDPDPSNNNAIQVVN